MRRAVIQWLEILGSIHGLQGCTTGTMHHFTQLYIDLDRTNRNSEKLEALRRYFRTAQAADAVWAVYLMTGRKLGRTINSRQMRDWSAELTGLPAWMIDECYHVVGDLSETLSLLLPPPTTDTSPPSLRSIVETRLKPLGGLAEPDQKKLVLQTWSELNAEQRFVFHKLISGTFRVGISAQSVVRALADVAGVDPAVMAHRLGGKWTPDETFMHGLMSPDDGSTPRDPALPYPFMLAHALNDPPESLGEINQWLIEWKWDGIRAQLIRREGKSAVWSRGDEMIAGAFPELIQTANSLPDGTVVDGEIVAWDETARRPMSFATLQRRLNRKGVEMSFWPDVPVAMILFDLLEWNGVDLRKEPLTTRRRMLEEFVANRPNDPLLRLSHLVEASTWESLPPLLTESRDRGVEGVMLKRLDTPYSAGRPTGPWWKLKVQPYTVDAVLIAAQPGTGRRAGLLTDYTFGVWENGQLVPVAKAYSGLTDDEIAEMDRFARRHTTGRYGPVHAVEPLRVFELGFEAIQRSDRHKAGVALRFPRILRQRTDKKPQDADTLQSLRDLLAVCEARG